MHLFPSQNVCRAKKRDRSGPANLSGRAWLCFIAAVFHLFSFVALAESQEASPSKEATQSGSLVGTVSTSESNSGALAGVPIKLFTDPPTGDPLTVLTNEQGRYEFDKLPPGKYTVSIELQGFQSVTRSIVVAPHLRNVQDFVLELAKVTEKVEVNESAAPVTTQTAATANMTITNQQLRTLPTADEKFKEVLPVTPGVIRTLDGRLVFKGSEEEQSLLLVNAARTTDPVTGSFAVPVPTAAVESIAVYKTPYDSSLGSFSGGLTAIDTKPPEERWSLRLTNVGISILGKNGQMVGLAAALPSVYMSAPLIKHKLYLSEVFQYDMKKTTVEGLPWPYDISKRQGFNSFTTFEAILSPSHILMVTVNAFPLRQQHLDISALIPQPASNDLNQSGVAIGLNDKYQLASGGIFSVVAQYIRFDSNAHGQGTDECSSRRKATVETISIGGPVARKSSKSFRPSNFLQKTGTASTTFASARTSTTVLSLA